jgi:hypothetical protein
MGSASMDGVLMLRSQDFAQAGLPHMVVQVYQDTHLEYGEVLLDGTQVLRPGHAMDMFTHQETNLIESQDKSMRIEQMGAVLTYSKTQENVQVKKDKLKELELLAEKQRQAIDDAASHGRSSVSAEDGLGNVGGVKSASRLSRNVFALPPPSKVVKTQKAIATGKGGGKGLGTGGRPRAGRGKGSKGGAKGSDKDRVGVALLSGGDDGANDTIVSLRLGGKQADDEPDIQLILRGWAAGREITGVARPILFPAASCSPDAQP